MLIDVLDDPSPRVREYAMVGLWELGERAGKACPRLIKLLSDDDRYVRSAAARCLGKISANADDRLSVVMALDSALVDKDADVRLAAADSLLELEETEKACAGPNRRVLLDRTVLQRPGAVDDPSRPKT